MRAWLSGVLMRLSGCAERVSFWLTDLSDRVRPRVKPSGPPLTLQDYLAMDRELQDRQRAKHADFQARENALFRELPFKEP